MAIYVVELSRKSGQNKNNKRYGQIEDRITASAIAYLRDFANDTIWLLVTI